MILVWQITDDSPNSPNFPAIRYDLHKFLDTQSILMYHSILKVKIFSK